MGRSGELASGQCQEIVLCKQSTNSQLRKAINNFCKEVGIDDDACDFQSSEIIISDGDIAEEILAKAGENECDLIVLGGYKNLFSARSAVGSTTKTVLKNAKIPVTIAPPLAV